MTLPRQSPTCVSYSAGLGILWNVETNEPHPYRAQTSTKASNDSPQASHGHAPVDRSYRDKSSFLTVWLWVQQARCVNLFP